MSEGWLGGSQKKPSNASRRGFRCLLSVSGCLSSEHAASCADDEFSHRNIFPLADLKHQMIHRDRKMLAPRLLSAAEMI